VSRARTLSETAEAQEAMLNRAIDVLLAQAERPTRGADEKITLKRNAKGETQPEVEGVRQEGESFAAFEARVRDVYERLCARYPTPNGSAHSVPLGGDE